MKDISNVVMDWVTYIGGINTVWVFMVAFVGTQMATLLGISHRNYVVYRLVPYIAGSLAGLVLINGSVISSFIVGSAIGCVSDISRSLFLFWLDRAAAKPWMHNLAAYIRGDTSD